MTRHMRMLPLFLVVGLAVGAQTAWGNDDDFEEFEEAEVLVEINATDGDAGFQGEIDGEPWDRLKLRAPGRRGLFSFRLRGSAAEQGFTELVWESAEPEFSEFGLAEFLERFPEGEYQFRGRKIDGGRLKSVVELTHDLPAGPTITSPEEGEGVPSGEDLVLEWDAVTTTFAIGDPQGEMTPPLESNIVRYLVEVEFEDEDADIKEKLEIEIPVLPGDMSASFSTTIPGDFLRFPNSDGYKVEVGAAEESGNRTFSEIPFCTDMECPEEDDEE